LEERPRELPPLRDLLEGLAARRADVAAYRALLARTDSELALAKRLAIPDVSLFGFVSQFDGGNGGNETAGGGSIGFSLPIFQGNGPSIDDAITERQRAAAELDDLVKLVEHNVASAYGTAQDAAEDLRTVLDEIIPRARENVELQQRRARRGEVRPYDTVDQELELVAAEEELVTAQRAYTDALIELEKAAALPFFPSPAGSPQVKSADADNKSQTQQQ
jgi:outer membrane protein TolC